MRLLLSLAPRDDVIFESIESVLLASKSNTTHAASGYGDQALIHYQERAWNGKKKDVETR